jgi:chemotaxis protein MotB
MTNNGGSWTITFSDMLTLLLTFFVFIIAVSVFKSPEYKEFWKLYQLQAQQKQAKGATASAKFALIKDLKLPALGPEAEQMLGEMEEAFADSDFEGADVYCDENKISLMVSEQLSFDGGKYDLKEEVKPLLAKLVGPIGRSKFDVNIEGHTDSQTSPGIDNMDLSLNRALSVARFLIGSGVDKKKISVSGYGPYRPVASNDSPDGRRLNRRVEVNVIIAND